MLLLLTLAGPVRATSYLLIHGIVGLAIGVTWGLRLPWAMSIPVTAAVKTGGIFLSLILTSFLVGEDVFGMVVAQMSNLAERLCRSIGMGSPAGTRWVVWLMVAVALANSLLYTVFLHIIYAAASSSSLVPSDFCRPPAFLRRALFASH